MDTNYRKQKTTDLNPLPFPNSVVAILATLPSVSLLPADPLTDATDTQRMTRLRQATACRCELTQKNGKIIEPFRFLRVFRGQKGIFTHETR